MVWNLYDIWEFLPNFGDIFFNHEIATWNWDCTICFGFAHNLLEVVRFRFLLESELESESESVRKLIFFSGKLELESESLIPEKLWKSDSDSSHGIVTPLQSINLLAFSDQFPGVTQVALPFLCPTSMHNLSICSEKSSHSRIDDSSHVANVRLDLGEQYFSPRYLNTIALAPQFWLFTLST